MRPPETLSSSFPFSCPAAKLHDLARIGRTRSEVARMRR